MTLNTPIRCGTPMSIAFICTFFLTLFSFTAQSQTLDFVTMPSTCESNGEIMVTCTGCSADAEFQITAGPICIGGNCPVNDLPTGTFASLPSGTYTIIAFNMDGIQVTGTAVVGGDYQEPIPAADYDYACPGEMDANINILATTNGTAPFEYRAFVGVVGDYPGAIGPTEMDLPFSSATTFTGFGTGVHSYQVKDACGVIRTGELVITDAPPFRINTSIGCTDPANCLTTIGISYTTGTVFLTDSRLSNYFPMDLYLVNPDGTEVLLETLASPSSPARYPLAECGGFYGLRFETACGTEIVTFPREYSCVSRSITYNDFCNTTTNQTEFSFNYGSNGSTGVCTTNQEVTVYTCDGAGQINSGVIYEGLVTGFNPPTADGDRYHFTITNNCNDSTHVVGCITPLTDPIRWYPVLACGDDLETIVIEESGTAFVYEAPASFPETLPYQIPVFGSYKYLYQVPDGDYKIGIDRGCGIDTFIVPVVDYDMEFEFVSSEITCQTTTLEVEVTHTYPQGGVNRHWSFISFGYENAAGSWVALGGSFLTNRIYSFVIDNNDCVENLEARAFHRSQREFTFCALDLGGLCYQVPDGVSVIGLPCQDGIQMCDDGSQPYNILATAPEMNGLAPFTWEIKIGGTEDLFIPITTTLDTFLVIEEVCVGDLTLDVFVTDACGQQIMSEIGFGVLTLDLLLEETSEVCSADTFDLNAIVKPVVVGGTWTATDGGPPPDMNGIVVTGPTDSGCFMYNYQLTPDNLPGICSNIDVPFELCVASGVPSIACPDTTMVECDGMGNPVELDAWIMTAMASGSCDTGAGMSTVTATLIESVSGNGLVSTDTYEFVADDGNGNTSVCTSQFIIEDTTPPLILGLSGMVSDTVGCEEDFDLALINWLGSIVIDEDCSGTPTITSELVSTTESCDGTNTVVTYMYSLTAEDDLGNISPVFMANFYSIDDTEPLITAPTDLEIECGNENLFLITTWIEDYVVTEACQDYTVTNDWDGLVPELCDDATFPIVWTVTDGCGASSTATANILVLGDTEGPEFQNCSGDLTVNVDADLCTANVIYSTPVATDCNGIESVTLTDGPASGTPFSLGPNTIEFTATDNCGNTTTCSFVITVEDSGIPTIVCPGNMENCADDGFCTWSSTDALLPSSMENCPGMEITHSIVSADGSIDAVDVVGTVVEGTAFPLGVNVITYTIVDGAGLASECSFEVLVSDCEAPEITCPENVSVECDGAGNTDDLTAFLLAVATDFCTDADAIEITTLAFNTVVSCGMTSTTTYQFTATDEAGNSSVCYADFEITDATPPVITTAAVDEIVECDGTGNTAGFISWLASNGGILDSEVTEGCGSFEWKNNLGDIAFMESPGCADGVGSWTVDFWVEDECGNESEPVTLQYQIDDTVPPTGITPVDITVQCGDATIDGTIANWLISYTLAPDCSEVTVVNDYLAAPMTCGDVVPVTWTATDECGNTTTATASIEMIDDEKPIIMNPPTALNIVCGSDNVMAIEAWLATAGGAIVVDNCATDVAITSTLVSEFGDCTGNQNTVYAFTFTDLCGNAITTDSYISLTDTTSPVIEALAADLNVVCDGTGNESDLTAWLGINGGAMAMDECSELTWSYALISSINACGDTGTDTYVFTASDDCGLTVSDTATFTITASLIILEGGEDYNTECVDSNSGNDDELLSWLNSNAGITATNDCGNIIWTNDFNEANWVDGCNNGRNIDVVFTATDACGNEESLTFNFSTSDNTDPEFINCPATAYVFETPIGQCEAFANFSLPIAEDNCGTPTVVQTDLTGLTSGSMFPLGITVLEYTATDDCGNSSTCEITIEVTDFSNELTVECPDSISVGNDLGECGATLEDIGLVISGNICGLDSEVTYIILDSLDQEIGAGVNDASGTFFELGVNTVIYSFVDQFGNDSECSFLVEVADIEAPTCAGDAGLSYAQVDTIVAISELDCAVEFEWNHPFFSDNCEGGTMEVIYEYLDTVTGLNSTESEILLSLDGAIDAAGETVTRLLGAGVTEITYVLVDAAGNLSMCSFTVSVEATEPPVFGAGCEDITVNLDAGECTAIIAPPIDLTNTCGIDTIIYTSDGEEIDLNQVPIGTTIIDIEAIDIYGNVGTCSIAVTVNEYDGQIANFGCNSQINISLNSSCEAVVTQDMILEGGPYGCYDSYCMEILDDAGNIVDNIFDLNDVGSTFAVSIVDCNGNGNTCWGYITIENKLIPELVCPADVTLMCNQDPSEVYPAGHPQAGDLVYGFAELETCEIDATITYSDNFVDFGECGLPRVELVRTWTVTDQDGNEVSCDQNFEFLPFDPMMVDYPQDYILDNSFECDEVENDPSLTEPENTGFPTFDGQSIFGNNYCDIHLGYWDEILADVNCPTAYLIYRHWVIDNECMPLEDGINPLEFIQRIKVKDATAPVIGDLEDVTINVDPWSCEGSYTLPAIMNTDDCSSFEVEWYASYGQIVGNELTKLLKGETEVNVRVQDACGNESFASFTISAVDLNPPTIISETTHTVSLSQDGIAKVYAEDLDDGSYDGCTDINFSVIRMDNGGACSPQDYFEPAGDDNTQLNEVVHFCCADVGDEPVMVQLQVCDDADEDGVFDSEGDNCNIVMIEVFVQDKLAPQIICPAPVTISCIDLAGLDLNDFDLLDELFGKAEAAVTCGVDVSQSTLGSEICGSGVLFRNFTATNAAGTVSCQQIVTVTSGPAQTLTCDRISFESISNSIYNWCDVNDNTNDPDDDLPAITVNCNDGLDIPGLEIDINGLCTQVGQQVAVDTFNFAGGACKKYVIHYEVIDQCVFDENYVDPATGELDPYNSANGYFEFYLEVDAFDDEAPEATCATLDLVSQSCTGYDGSFGITAADNCTDTEFLSYQWRIDVGADNVIDFPATGWYTTSEVSPDQFGLDEFPVGQHTVYWVISDGCGNNETCAQTINILSEDKQPTPYCIDGLSVAAMPANGTVALWAKDFDAGSFDNCDGQLTLSMIPEVDLDGINSLEAYGLSFTHPNVTQQANGDWGFEFDCSYILNGVTAILEVRIYITDEDGNWDYCTASLRIDDNFGACDDSGMMLNYEASGSLKTESEMEIEQVQVEVDASFPEFPMTETFDGSYSFDLLESIDYSITPLKDDNHLNGISSIDILFIQKHILGLEVISSPYMKIAADVNNDCKINGIDIIQLRKLLLGKYINDELPNNTSWRFVEASYVFEVNDQPCDYSEVAEIENLSDDVVNDFVGVKIGDLNSSAESNATEEAETRSIDAIQLHVSEMPSKDANYSYVDFTIQEITDLYGFQMNLDLTNSNFVDISSEILGISESNIGISADNKTIFLSFDNVNGVRVEEGDVLFTLKLEKLASENIFNSVALNNATFADEAYVEASLNIKNIKLSFSEETIVSEDILLMQNEPNPFTDQTNITFSIPAEGKVKLSIYDLNGTELYTINQHFDKGMNVVQISSREIATSGVLYYKIEMGDLVATKKMIVIGK